MVNSVQRLCGIANVQHWRAIQPALVLVFLELRWVSKRKTFCWVHLKVI